MCIPVSIIVILPPCEDDGQNYLRCDPDTVLGKDVDTCDDVDENLCSKGEKKLSEDEIEYCECIGLPPIDARADLGHLRGVVGVQGVV